MPDQNNITVTLVRIPGTGASSVTLTAGATVADLVHKEDLHGRSMYVDGQTCSADQLSGFSLTDGQEVFATGAVKGN